ncbi:MAG TPA: hypothetical protein VFW33_18690 [Gemmataceae bacterium]|nr:hypothetical protein [Gemmataceae bacterium]
MKVRTSVKAGGYALSNHNEAAVKVRTAIKAGKLAVNHNEA